MDELWKDMSLSSTPLSLQSYQLHTPYRGAVNLQEYLAGAGAVPQPPRRPLPPPLHTALTPEFTYLGGTNSAASSGDDPAGPLFVFSASGGQCSGSGSRGGVMQSAAVAGGDRRHCRKMKNRESAARSRARKQAYTNELELELAQLRRENQMLIQREQDLINDRLAKAAQAAVPDCSSRSSRGRRCRSAPAP